MYAVNLVKKEMNESRKFSNKVFSNYFIFNKVKKTYINNLKEINPLQKKNNTLSKTNEKRGHWTVNYTGTHSL